MSEHIILLKIEGLIDFWTRASLLSGFGECVTHKSDGGTIWVRSSLNDSLCSHFLCLYSSLSLFCSVSLVFSVFPSIRFAHCCELHESKVGSDPSGHLHCSQSPRSYRHHHHRPGEAGSRYCLIATRCNQACCKIKASCVTAQTWRGETLQHSSQVESVSWTWT